MERLPRALRAPFTVDLRALGLLRIAVGLLILADLFLRSGDWLTFLGAEGLYGAELSRSLAEPWRLSLYWLFDDPRWTVGLGILGALAALTLTLGIRPWVSTLVSLLLLASLHNRNPLVLQGGDNLLLLLLFWGLFLPWGARLSLAAAVQRPLPEGAPGGRSSTHLSIASKALIFQVLAVYFFSAFLKNGDAWRVDGTAIYYALSHNQFAAYLAPLWADWHGLTVPLSRYVWWLELLAPVLALWPTQNPWPRTLAALGLITLELGFILNLKIGLFPFISIASLLVLLPPAFWDSAARLAARPAPPLAIYFDRDCGFCEKTCLLLWRVLGLNLRHLGPAQDHPELGPLLEREVSWIVITEDGTRHLRWGALATVFASGQRLRWLAPGLRATTRPGNRIYHFVGEQRRLFGRATAVLLPWAPTPSPAAPPGLAALAFLAVVGWNITSLPALRTPDTASALSEASLALRRQLEPVIQSLRLDQHWNMFAPYPSTVGGWYLFVGLTEDGQLVDVLHDRATPPNPFMPKHFVPENAPNYRWRKYLSRISRSRYEAAREGYETARCAQWNARAALDPSWPKLLAFNSYQLRLRTPTPGADPTPPTPKRFGQALCPGAPESARDAVEVVMLNGAQP